MPRPVRSHPESPVRRIQKRPIAGAVDAGPQATAAWRDRQRVHGPATRCCRTQAENQSLLDHGSQRSAFPSGLRTSLGEQLVTNVNCCLHHNHRTTHSTEVYAVFSPGRVQRRWCHDLEMPAGIGRCGQGGSAGGGLAAEVSRRPAPGRTSRCLPASAAVVKVAQRAGRGWLPRFASVRTGTHGPREPDADCRRTASLVERSDARVEQPLDSTLRWSGITPRSILSSPATGRAFSRAVTLLSQRLPRPGAPSSSRCRIGTSAYSSAVISPR